MEKKTPNDSILLPEGIVEDDPKLLILNKAFSELADETFFGDKKREEGERQDEKLKD